MADPALTDAGRAAYEAAVMRVPKSTGKFSVKMPTDRRVTSLGWESQPFGMDHHIDANGNEWIAIANYDGPSIFLAQVLPSDTRLYFINARVIGGADGTERLFPRPALYDSEGDVIQAYDANGEKYKPSSADPTKGKNVLDSVSIGRHGGLWFTRNAWATIHRIFWDGEKWAYRGAIPLFDEQRDDNWVLSFQRTGRRQLTALIGKRDNSKLQLVEFELNEDLTGVNQVVYLHDKVPSVSKLHAMRVINGEPHFLTRGHTKAAYGIYTRRGRLVTLQANRLFGAGFVQLSNGDFLIARYGRYPDVDNGRNGENGSIVWIKPQYG